MGDISNNLLVVLVVAAMAISIGGTLVTLSAVQPGFQFITGGATTGNLTFVIEQEVSLNVTADIVNFGPGRVNSDETNCTISTADGANADCGNWTYVGSVSNFTVENTGNVDANVDISSSANADTGIGGGAGSIPDPIVQYMSYNSEAGSCTNVYPWSDLNTTGGQVCYGFNSTNSKDEFKVGIKINIPQDATPGSKETTVTFTISAA